MPAAASTKAEAALQERLAEVPEGSERHAVLRAALDFKSSWVTLGERLSEVAGTKSFEQWGYKTFETYCAKELHIKRETALKLTRSYGFLEQHEPQLLKTEAPLPEVESVHVLQQARDNPYLSEEDYRDLRRQVFEGAATPRSLQKQVREKAPQYFEAKQREKPQDDGGGELKRAGKLAEQLYTLVLNLDLSAKSVQAFEVVLAELREARDHAATREQ